MRVTTAYVSLIHPSLREANRVYCKAYYFKNKDTLQWNRYYKELGKDVVDGYIKKYGPGGAKIQLKRFMTRSARVDRATQATLNNALIEAKNAMMEVKNAMMEVKNAMMETENALMEAENARMETENALMEAKNALIKAKNA